MKIHCIVALLVVSSSCNAQEVWQSRYLTIKADSSLEYHADNAGNVLPDFSRVGYKAALAPIPEVPIVLTLSPGAADEGQRIQSAINQIALRKPDASGFRGALLLKKGVYRIAGSIKISASGIVLRGEGDSTRLIATGAVKRELIVVNGEGEPIPVSTSLARIVDRHVPVGAFSFAVDKPDNFKPGDRILLRRPGTANWIHDLGMDAIAIADSNTKQWQAKEYDLYFRREVTGVDGNRITMDNPVVMEMDSLYGGGEIMPYDFAGSINLVGIENLRCESEYRSDVDEEHGWSAVTFNRVDNGWVRNLTAMYFGYAAVHLKEMSTHVTVDSCRSLSPKSKIIGGRRYAFTIDGQLCLVKNCFSSEGRHDFVTGARVCGPNVFYNCRAVNSHADTGPHHRWSVGTLYDNVSTDNEINAQDRGNWGTGHGWAGVNQYFWNCSARSAAIQDPWVSGKNYVFGMKARPARGRLSGRTASAWEKGNGGTLRPQSLYEAQCHSTVRKNYLQRFDR